MCLYGTHKEITVINPAQQNKKIKVDACIADEIQQLNNTGVITLGCCCGHGQAGKVLGYGDKDKNFNEYQNPPITLIDENCIEFVKTLGYKPYPYYYLDGEFKGTWQMQLKSGCITKKECMEWHQQNDIPYEANIGVINV